MITGHTPDDQRWSNAATDYVRLRTQAIALQTDIDDVRKILKECVAQGGEPKAFLVRDESVVVLIACPFNAEHTIQVRAVIE